MGMTSKTICAMRCNGTDCHEYVEETYNYRETWYARKVFAEQMKKKGWSRIQYNHPYCDMDGEWSHSVHVLWLCPDCTVKRGLRWFFDQILK